MSYQPSLSASSVRTYPRLDSPQTRRTEERAGEERRGLLEGESSSRQKYTRELAVLQN